jgi:hypothetical protein
VGNMNIIGQVIGYIHDPNEVTYVALGIEERVSEIDFMKEV